MQYIFSDKTGTLTQNIMTFNKVCLFIIYAITSLFMPNPDCRQQSTASPTGMYAIHAGILSRLMRFTCSHRTLLNSCLVQNSPQVLFSSNPYFEDSFKWFDKTLKTATQRNVPEVSDQEEYPSKIGKGQSYLYFECSWVLWPAWCAHEKWRCDFFRMNIRKFPVRSVSSGWPLRYVIQWCPSETREIYGIRYTTIPSFRNSSFLVQFAYFINNLRVKLRFDQFQE